MQITPSWVTSFQNNLITISTDNWRRVQKRLMWDRVMKIAPKVGGKVKTIHWILETARIYPENNGGNKRYDDVASAMTTLEVTDSGAGLILRANEIRDNQLKDNPNVGVIDFSVKWSKGVGGHSAYWPQQQLFALIKNGLVGLGYDGLPFFHAAHPLNPLGGGGTYSNIITGVPMTLVPGVGETQVDAVMRGRLNLGKVLGKIRSQRFFGGIPRFLEPGAILCPTDIGDQINLVNGEGIISQTSNDTKKQLDVFVCPELDDEPGVYYVVVEDLLDDDLGAFMYDDYQPYVMSTYTPMEQAELNRMKVFEWSFDGRNTSIYGNPYAIYRCTA